MLGCIQPMSSPMMNRMLGFCCDCWAKAGASVAAVAAHSAARPSQANLLVLITALLQVQCLAAPGSDVAAVKHAGATPYGPPQASFTERLLPDLFQTPSRNAIVLRGRCAEVRAHL